MSLPEITNEANRARAIAFYLPQFHPVKENNEWWGPGFSEWTNTAKARPLYRGHNQPHIPADLGFYDLRVPETRSAQAELASQYGISAFCYWHYWFGAGRTILEMPLQEVLATGDPAQQFCLAWANQTWTGIWHGAENRILIEQTYPGPDDDRAHFEHILPALTDKRYLTVDGKPLFYVFRPEQIPNVQEWVKRWRSMAQESGLQGLYLVAEVSDLLGKGPKFTNIGETGFDAGVYIRLPVEVNRRTVLRMRAERKLLGRPERYSFANKPTIFPPKIDSALLHPCVYPNWDNTPRSGSRGLVVSGSRPSAFERHVQEAVEAISDRPPQQRLLFIKSWNEWAEGNYLEPDLEFGHGYLEALSRTLQ